MDAIRNVKSAAAKSCRYLTFQIIRWLFGIKLGLVPIKIAVFLWFYAAAMYTMVQQQLILRGK